MRLAGPFAHNSIKKNLIHLKEGQDIGQWRDSEYGEQNPAFSKIPRVYL